MAPARRGRPPKHEAAKLPPTRDRIIAAAADGVTKYGLQGVSMEQVAYEAGITPGAVYRHFEDKAHLVRATVVHLLAKSTEANSWVLPHIKVEAGNLATAVVKMAAAGNEALRRFFAEIIAATFTDKALAEQIVAHDTEIRTRIANSVVEAQQAGTVDASLDPDMTAALLLVLTSGLTALDVIKPEYVGDPAFSEFMAAAIARLLGVCPER